MHGSGLPIPAPLTKRTNGVMKRPVLVVLAAVVTAVLTMLGTGVAPTPRASAQTGDGTPVTTTENNCYEIDIRRGANLDNLKATKWIPQTYWSKLTGTFDFIDYSCEQVSVDDQTPQRMTASLVAARLNDGSNYILAHATNNQQLAEHYSALGLPTKYQPKTESEYKARMRPDVDCCLDAAGLPAKPDVEVDWKIVGDGLDHTIDAKTTAPPESPITASTARFIYETDTGQQLLLTYNNSTRPSVDAWVFADFRQATYLTELFAILPGFPDDCLWTIPRCELDPDKPIRFGNAFQVGSWTSTLQQTNDLGTA
jgi:hypothetical protein